jgi:hypothetical protein
LFVLLLHPLFVSLKGTASAVHNRHRSNGALAPEVRIVMNEATTNRVEKRETALLSIAGWTLGFLTLIPFFWIFSTWFILPDVSLTFRSLFTLGCIVLIVIFVIAAKRILTARNRREQ